MAMTLIFKGKLIRQKLVLLFTLSLLSSAAISQSLENDVFRLFFLGGQSNMEGHGLNADLPDSLTALDKNVWLFHGTPKGDEDTKGGLGKWELLQPGNGAGFSSDGMINNYSAKFGPELSFGRKLAQLYPGEKIALIKYARGGSSIDSLTAREYGSWEMDYRGRNGINQFDNYLKTIKAALSVSDIDGNGTEDVLIPQGIIWMQGESDAVHSEELAQRYYANLKRLMDLMRASLLDDDLAVVIGEISDSGEVPNGKVWEYGELIQYAQEKFVKNDINAAIVRDTKNYNYSDPYHYDSQGYLDLGEKFAMAVYQLIERE